MLRVSETRFYLVPVIMRALDILEFLRTSGMPMKSKEISIATKIPPTTTYRVLRTLLHRGYVTQDIQGRFSFLTCSPADVTPPRRKDTGQNRAFESKADLSGEEVVELLHSVLECIRNANNGSTIRVSMDGFD